MEGTSFVSFTFFSFFAEKMPNETELQNTMAIKKEKTAAEPITIPIVLKMAEFDHKVCFNVEMFIFPVILGCGFLDVKSSWFLSYQSINYLLDKLLV